MDFLADVLQWTATNVFSEVAILIGLITLIGLLLQRKPVEETIAGALRATVGVVILFIGIGVFVEGLVAFQTIVASAVGLEPPAATRTLGDFLGEYGGAIALIITVAFLIHVLLVRFLRTRYVYLTGHLMFWIAVVAAASLVQVFGAVDTWILVVAGAVVVGLYWTIQPLYIAPLMRKVIGSDDWGYAHTSSAACFLAAKLGRFVGSKEKHDTEKLVLPKQLTFFKDINVSTALVLGVIVVVAAIFADPDVLAEQAAAYNPNISPWVWAFVAALRFAAGIAILLFGVRMFLAEIVPAFKGISEKVIPGSRPALDVPTVFPFAPTAVMLGFVSGTVVFLVLMGVFAAVGWFVLVPPMIMLFFPGGGAGVFGNAVAGWRGAVLGGSINGLFLAIGQAVTWGMLSDTAPELATLADPDWYIIIWITLGIGALASALGDIGIWLVPAAFAVGFAVWLAVLKRRRVDVVVEPISESAPLERPDAQASVTSEEERSTKEPLPAPPDASDSR
ncbi:MAG TPA: PTS ascorbate transporter subunit IIC [Candidatus Limnocylindrales bacterium]|jgi:ascorbate PTS system EIIC component|nr:PTS ascorbate transporter subunit IIC [Candidatus Limnocylindrales bacterium]